MATIPEPFLDYILWITFLIRRSACGEVGALRLAFEWRFICLC